MSVLIKDMEMPKSCLWRDGKCPLLGDDDGCKLQDCQEEWTWQDQYKGCPLSDVPDTNVGDMVYRHAAIDAIRESTLKYTGFMEMEMYTDDDAVEVIKAMPPAQPEIIRCKECVHYMRNWYCEAWNNSPGFPAVHDEMFCSMAKRREDGEKG